jgi:AcrR family transcriptional regulator
VRELLRASPEAVVTTEQIAERAELAPATVYNLVGPREKIWEALAGSFMEELERRLGRPPSGDPLSRARDVVRTTVELFVEDPAVSRRMLSGWGESGLVLDRTPLTHLRAALAEAQEEGALRQEVDVGVLASVIRSACMGALHEWAAGVIGATRFRIRALQALDVALAAAATDRQRGRYLDALRGRRAPPRRSGRPA